MKKLKQLLWILFFLVVSCYLCGIAGAIPQRINYQAVLKNKATGQILPDGNYTLTFRLYTASTGSSALWTETATVTITNGILTHQLGSVTPLNLAFDQNYYLGIQIAGDSEMSPREQLVSLGYAFVAQNAEMLNGYNPGNSSGNIPINNGTLNTGLNADLLDGQHRTFYQNASNLTTGNLSVYRLRGFYTYTSTTVTHYAFNADKLDGQHGSFYQDASNLNAGILPSGRLVGSYSSASVSFADSASNAANGLSIISSAPYTITLPGSYLLVSDLYTVSNQTAITIVTSYVTIDLNGHTLFGAGTTVGSTGYGIYASIAQDNITITNGNVCNFRYKGIVITGDNHQVIEVKTFGNKYEGIEVGNYSIIKGCIAKNNGGNGFEIGSGCTVTGNSASANGMSGIFIGSNGSNITYNCAAGNGSYGIYVGGGSTVIGNSAYNNRGHGIGVGKGCTVTGNSTYLNDMNGIYTSSYGCIMNGNTASNNGRHGIYGYSGTTLIGNSAFDNDSSGIYIESGCQAMNNTSRINVYAGIEISGTGNSVSQNLCTLNKYGLRSAAGNYFEQNKLWTNTTADESLGGSTEGSGDLANVIF